jgi:hypothetical protein
LIVYHGDTEPQEISVAVDTIGSNGAIGNFARETSRARRETSGIGMPALQG